MARASSGTTSRWLTWYGGRPESVTLSCIWTTGCSFTYMLVCLAEIVSARQTNMYVNEQPVVQMQLNVTLSGRPPYQVSHREVVPLLALAMIQPGHSVPV